MARKTIDGTMYYTFVGLLNRMDSRNMGFSKDIPEEIEFKGDTYVLNDEKTAYFHKQNKTTSLAEMAAAYYFNDTIKYLTEFEFIVRHKEKVKVTQSERMLIRYVSMFGERYADYVSVERGNLGGGFRTLYLWDEDGVANSVDINDDAFNNLKPGIKYKLQDLEVVEYD